MMDCSLRELQLTELEILIEFDRLCKEHSVTYFLAWGTLLGAIRHKGFIPWDDDIDVFVPYEDYVRLQEICTTYADDKFYFQSRNLNPQNFIFWQRLGMKNTASIDLNLKNIKADWGICIDIFPLFPVSSDLQEQAQQKKNMRKLQILSLKYLNREMAKSAKGLDKIKKWISGHIPDAINRSQSEKLLKKIGTQTAHTDQYCFDYTETYRDYFESSWFSESIDVEFEGMMFPVPVGYDALLTSLYQDYMVVPEEGNRVMHTDNDHVIVSLTKSYQEYLD